MKLLLLAAAMAGLMLASTASRAATSVLADQFQVSITDYPDDIFDSLVVSGQSVFATGSAAYAFGSITDMRNGAPLNLSILANPGFNIIGLDITLVVSSTIGTYDGPKYGSDGAAYTTFSSSFFGNGTFTETAATDFNVHINGSALPSDFFSLYAHGETFCSRPLDQCTDMGDGQDLTALITVDSLTITPEFGSMTSPAPEPGQSAMLLAGLAGLGLAARRRRRR